MKRLFSLSLKQVGKLIVLGLCIGLGLVLAIPLFNAYHDRAAIETVYFRNNPALTPPQMQAAQQLIATYAGIDEHIVVDEGRALKVTFDTQQTSARRIRSTLECAVENAADMSSCVTTRLATEEDSTGS